MTAFHFVATLSFLVGKTCVLTGVFPEVGGGAGLNLGKDRVRARVEAYGGRVPGSSSGRTDGLVGGRGPRIYFESIGRPRIDSKD